MKVFLGLLFLFNLWLGMELMFYKSDVAMLQTAVTTIHADLVKIDSRLANTEINSNGDITNPPKPIPPLKTECKMWIGSFCMVW